MISKLYGMCTLHGMYGTFYDLGTYKRRYFAYYYSCTYDVMYDNGTNILSSSTDHFYRQKQR